MTFTLPESYRAYCSDAAVRTAVDHILASKSLSLPADIEWKDLPAFHRAVLSAHQVRCEYAMFLIEFWDTVWKPALEKFDLGPTREIMTVAESEKWADQRLDTNTVWNSSWFNRHFKFTNSGFSFYAGAMVDVDHVMLAIDYYDAAGVRRTADLELGEKWSEDEAKNDCAYTSKKLAPIQDGGIALAPLRKAASDALDAIKAHESDR